MNPISFLAPAGVPEAMQALSGAASLGDNPAAASTKFIAGGTNLIDLMKERVMQPVTLIDINGLPLDGVSETAGGGLMLGALARNADTAYHPLVRELYPLLSAAILAGASAQIRNMATNGGNLLQRTRCHYFYDVGVACNKRDPGSGCTAIGGLTRQHAILGTSPLCIATHPSDMCVALAALGAVVHVQSPSATRQIAFANFHRLPGERPDLDTTLAADELITGIELPPAPQFAAHSAYLKFRERSSYAFALVSVAAALDLGADGTIREARLALGGVAHRPWRVPLAEALLQGQAPDAGNFARAADAMLEGAQAQPGQDFKSGNEFKIPMALRAVVRGLQVAAAGTVSNQEVT